jgi:uncharacterized membrane protein YhaH (DUF805 family)
MMQSPGRSISNVFRRAFQFNGRSQRSEYWWWALFVIILNLAAGLLEPLIDMPYFLGMSLLSLIIYAIYFVPDLTVGWRRLQDTSRPGWIYGIYVATTTIMSIIPNTLIFTFMGRADGVFNANSILVFTGIYLILFALLIVLLALPSQKGDNRFGPHPYEDQSASVFD